MSIEFFISCLNGPSGGAMCAIRAAKGFLTMFCMHTEHSCNTLYTVAAIKGDHHTACKCLMASSSVILAVHVSDHEAKQ